MIGSDLICNAFGNDSEDVLITERDFDNDTQFRRLNKGHLALWLEKYSLEQLWRMGEIGGTLGERTPDLF